MAKPTINMIAKTIPAAGSFDKHPSYQVQIDGPGLIRLEWNFEEDIDDEDTYLQGCAKLDELCKGAAKVEDTQGEGYVLRFHYFE